MRFGPPSRDIAAIALPSCAAPVVNSTVLPSGRICGHVAGAEPPSGVGTPPPAEIRIKSPPRVAHTIVSSGPHVPPMLTFDTLTIRNGVPPATATFCKAPAAKNASHVPLGEKNGCRAPAVPGMACASVALKARTKICDSPPSSAM